MLSHKLLVEHQEELKRRLNESAPCQFQVDPISGTDCYYTDGAATRACGKITFCVRGKYYTVYIYPEGDCFGSCDDRVKDVLNGFLTDVKGLEERKN